PRNEILKSASVFLPRSSTRTDRSEPLTSTSIVAASGSSRSAGLWACGDAHYLGVRSVVGSQSCERSRRFRPRDVVATLQLHCRRMESARLETRLRGVAGPV